mmetsp:Transcript_41533/g.50344  ORF Transcript_41533/g.50344 Transcript_41533/m.50344 type:complete len:281 (-) Transcript_41533:276-1118(-)|eukprot:CAMPEP_0197848530 /NCGR_PEP_ID=MMETSP1438-20131217/9010_1 /TAXON_ID=1461541 /ORGANISM="Pterosperma sp., Strain CCMP1384" /LENGTH=280 /DNA_ID=CAMNT_0043460819 /DNA_START=108 /DNA_END=950 /DNA_ORIENTATION=-
MPEMKEAVAPVMAAPAAQSMDGDNGTNFLVTTDGLFIKQRLELLEAFTNCETKNKYFIALMPRDTPIDKDALSALPELMSAKEQSECFERICLPNLRSVNLPFSDSIGRQFFSFSRPCTCTCILPGVCGINNQAGQMYDQAGRQISHIEEEVRCGWCCTRVFHASAAGGNMQYTGHVAECNTREDGCNFCAPSCFNDKFTVDVFKHGAEEAAPVTKIYFIWPGCNCGGLTDRSNIAVKFPPGASADERASLVGMAMLTEYSYFEWRKNQDNNNGGGGLAA